MTPEQFRQHGHAVIDWIADYYERIESFPVLSQVAPGDIRAALPPHPPEHGEPFDDVLRDLDDVIMPGITHWQHPSFFAYFPANASGPAILGDLLASGLGVQGMLWATSPAATELETHVLDWLAELLGLPERFRSERARRRRHPAHRVRRRARRPAGRTAPGQRRRHRARRRGPRALRRLHLGPDALVGREGVPGRRPRRRRAAQARRRPGHARGPTRPPARADRRRPGGRRRARARRRVGRRHRHRLGRPVRELGHDRARGRRVGARRRGVGRRRRGRTGAAVAQRRRRARRLLRHEPAQVAAHQLRLRRVLGRRPRGARRRRCRSCPSTCATPPANRAR